MDTFRADVKALLRNGIETSTPTEDAGITHYPEHLTSGFYRVRKKWEDKNSQIGAYKVLSNARKQADANPGYYVFSNDGMSIYPTAETGVDKAQESYAIYTVVKGDSLWAIAQKHLGSGTRYTEIKSLNGLTSNIIYSGQKLKLPK